MSYEPRTDQVRRYNEETEDWEWVDPEDVLREVGRREIERYIRRQKRNRRLWLAGVYLVGVPLSLLATKVLIVDLVYGWWSDAGVDFLAAAFLSTITYVTWRSEH